MVQTLTQPTAPTYGMIRVPQDVIDRIKEIAAREDRSANFIGTRLLREALEQQSKPKR